MKYLLGVNFQIEMQLFFRVGGSIFYVYFISVDFCVLLRNKIYFRQLKVKT